MYDNLEQNSGNGILVKGDDNCAASSPLSSLTMERGPTGEVTTINHNRSLALGMCIDPVLPSRWDKDDFGHCWLDGRYVIDERMHPLRELGSGIKRLRQELPHLESLEDSILYQGWGFAGNAVNLSVDGVSGIQAMICKAVAGLGGLPLSDDVNDWSRGLYAAYTGERRLFHSLEHVSKLCSAFSEKSSRQSYAAQLGALFHDVVYLTTDTVLNEWMQHTLKGLVDIIPGLENQPTDTKYRLSAQNSKTKLGRLSIMCSGIFGFDPQEEIPSRGRNEFLSALIAVKVLGTVLPMNVLVHIVTCIEATIPFRSFTTVSPSTALERRVQATIEQLGIRLSRQELSDVMIDACMLANEDVSDFFQLPPEGMLSNTWLLMPELNSCLFRPDYTIGEWRWALQKLYFFFNVVVDPEQVFRRPETLEDYEFQEMKEQCRQNRDFAKLCLQAMVVSAAILESLAGVSGGDVLVSYISDTYAATTSTRLGMTHYNDEDSVGSTLSSQSDVVENEWDSSYVGDRSRQADFMRVKKGLLMLDRLIFFDHRLKAWEGVAHDLSKRCLESTPLSKLEEMYEVIASKWKDPETMLGKDGKKEQLTFLKSLPPLLLRKALARAEMIFPKQRVLALDTFRAHFEV